jgi:transcriptional regulator with XRE-family HTH domain
MPGEGSPPRAPAEAISAAPRWNTVLRALREARGVTQEGWAAQLGVGRRTVQRWERGEVPPDPIAEASLLAYCREKALFRSYDRGSLAGLTVMAEWLQSLLIEAWLSAGSRCARPQRNQPVITA